MSHLPLRLYEGMYVVRPTLSEEARERAIGRVITVIERLQGEHHKSILWGKRKLEYEIKGCKEGFFHVIYFSLPACNMDELVTENHINEDLVRFMNIRIKEVPEWEEISFKTFVLSEK